MQSSNTSLNAWLATQCQLLGDVSAALLVRDHQGARQILAKWPKGETPNELLQRLVIQAANKQRLHIEPVSEQQYRLALPLVIDAKPWGFLALELRVPDKKALATVLKDIKLGQFWLQFLIHQQQAVLASAAATASPASPPLANSSLASQLPITAAAFQEAALQLGATLIKENTLAEVAISLVNLLASQLGAVRVSLGLLDKQIVRLQAVSFSAHFDPRTQAMQAVTEAMQEALEQGLAISFSPSAGTDTDVASPSGLITRAHQQLQHAQQLQWVGSFPLRRDDRLLGVLCIELDNQTQLSQAQQTLVQTALHFAGGIIALQQDVSASFKQRLVRGLNRRLHVWLGGESWRGRILLALAVTLLIALFVPVTYRMNADASLQTTEKYLVVAPQDGYLGEVAVRPGDSVTKTALLASLRNDDLTLERRKLASQVQRYRQAYDTALANADRVEAAIANAQMDQAVIQLRLVEQQLQRTKLLAPMDGIVVSDDISQKQGAPLKQGDVLFELAAANAYVVQLFVDERDIASVTAGQTGQVKFTSLPNQLLMVTVTRITPISEVREGRNYFRVELALANQPPEILALLRPGMTGTGKIAVGKRALGWVWFHDLWHWLRLSVW